MTSTAKPCRSRGMVRLHSKGLYRWPYLARLLGWEAHAMRQARLEGFPIVKIGRDCWVLGSSALAWFARLEAEQTGRLTPDQTGSEQIIEENGRGRNGCCRASVRRPAE